MSLICGKCGKPTMMMSNLNGGAAASAGPLWEPRCNDCAPVRNMPPVQLGDWADEAASKLCRDVYYADAPDLADNVAAALRAAREQGAKEERERQITSAELTDMLAAADKNGYERGKKDEQARYLCECGRGTLRGHCRVCDNDE